MVFDILANAQFNKFGKGFATFYAVMFAFFDQRLFHSKTGLYNLLRHRGKLRFSAFMYIEKAVLVDCPITLSYPSFLIQKYFRSNYFASSPHENYGEQVPTMRNENKNWRRSVVSLRRETSERSAGSLVKSEYGGITNGHPRETNSLENRRPFEKERILGENILKTYLKIGIVAVLAFVALPSYFLVTGAYSQPVYYVTPKTQSFQNHDFFTNVCTSNPNIQTVKVILTAPDGTSATSTFKLQGHCISFDASVPNDRGTFKITALFFAHGELKGKASAIVGGV